MITSRRCPCRNAASSALPELDRLLLAVRGRRALGRAEAAQDHAEERAVHRLAHDVGEDRARGADQRPAMISIGVVEREADARRRPARVAVEHRDHHRHVGAADRDDDQHARARTRCAVMTMNGSHCLSGRPGRSQTPKPIIAMREREVEQVLALEHHRGAGEQPELLAQPGELAERDHRAGEGDRADEGADEELELVAASGSASGRPNAAGLLTTAIAISTAAMPTSECIAATSSGICVICTRRATTAPIAPPIGDADEDQPTLRGERERQRDATAISHADDAEQVAAARGLRVRQALQRQDEQHATRRGTRGRLGWRSCVS